MPTKTWAWHPYPSQDPVIERAPPRTRHEPRRIRGAFALVLGLAAGAGTSAALAERPNIVFILADDLGANDLSCYGRKDHPTPHLDALAAQGMRFTAAYAAQPLCSPTRAALLTGKTPARLRITTFLPGR